MLLPIPGCRAALCACLVLLAGGAAATAQPPADGPAPPNTPPRFVRPTVIHKLKPEDGAAGEFEFTLHGLVPGARYQLTFREHLSASETGLPGGSSTFEPTAAKCVIRLNYKGEAHTGLLGDGPDRFPWRFESEGTDRHSFVSTLQPVLRDLPREHKQVRLYNDGQRDSERGEYDAVVYAIVPVTAPEAAALSEVYPRAELVVAPQVNLDRSRERDFTPGLLPRLQTIWAAQRGEIGTARIRYLEAFGSEPLAVSREELEQLFHEFSKQPDVASLQRFRRQFTNPEGQDAQRFLNAEIHPHEFLRAGDKWRTRKTWSATQGTDLVWDGRFLLHHSQLNPGPGQLDVNTLRTSGLRTANLEDFRTIPSPSPKIDWATAESGDELTITLRPAANADPDSPPHHYELIVDSYTGSLRREFRSVYGRETLIVQHGATTYDGRIVFPKARLEAEWNRGKLSRMRVTAIVEAAFNETVAASEFVLAVPQGTTLVDGRRDTYRPQPSTAGIDIDDAAAYVDEQDLISGQ